MSTGSITSLGIGSGIDIQSILDQLREVDEQPIEAKKDTVTELEQKLAAFDTVNSTLLSMRTNALDLSLASNFLETTTNITGTSVDATSISGAKVMSHTIDVTSLASSSSWISEGVDSKSSAITTEDSTFIYKLGENGATISLDVNGGTSLEELVSLINDDGSNPGVTASIVDTGVGDNPYKLVLASDESGEESRIFIENQMAGLKLKESTGAGHSAPESDNQVQISASEPIDISAANTNNQIIFRERVADGSLGVEKTATIADGSYTSGEDLAAAIETAMEDGSDNSIDYSVTFDSETQKFTITENGSELHELEIGWNKSSAAASLGFDSEADSYTPYDSSLNARFTVDNIEYQRQSNDDIDDVVQGVTIDLKETGKSTIGVESDFGTMESTIQGLVDSLNNMRIDLDSKSSYDVNTGEKGILFGESSITRVDDDLKNFMERSLNLNGNISSLYDLGLTIDEDGNISIDTDLLSEALSSNAEDVIKFFTGDSDQGVVGFGDLLYDKLREYTSADGLMGAEEDSIQTRITKMNEQIDKDTELLDKRYEALTLKYVQMDSYIRQMESNGDLLDQFFGSTSSDE